MDKPTTIKELRMFIGMVNYYRDMWPSRAHILKPLTDQTGKKKFIWTDEMDTAFQRMKKLVAMDALCAYPNHNEPFHIYTDSSDFQMGACIMQNKVPVAYYSKKLNSAQRNYTTMEKELLSIVMTLKEFRSMILGSEIHIYTDHKNLTFENLQSQRVLRWRCNAEEYSPSFHYIPGSENVLADNLSRLNRFGENIETDFTKGKSIDPEDTFYCLVEDMDMFNTMECYLNLLSCSPSENPLNYECIKREQSKDSELQGLLRKYPMNYVYKTLDDVDGIICYVKPHNDRHMQWKVALARSILKPTIQWFHHVLNHPGSKRLRMTMQTRYYHPELRRYIDKHVCDTCQRHKLEGPGYGLLPQRDLKEQPFEEVAVDLIGPWSIEVANEKLTFNALTCIDTVTNLVELVRIDNKSSQHIRNKFEQTWLARYPWPRRCIHDKGGEFTGEPFQRLLEATFIKDVCSTSKNPQSNAICERMHQTIGNILRTLMYSNPPKDADGACGMIDSALAIAMHAMRTNIASTLESSPGALVFNRDMFLNLPLIADWHLIAKRREHFINENLRRQNSRRRNYDYAVGMQVLKKIHDPTKMGPRTQGPFTILTVHANGNLTIELRSGVTERVNIRQVLPYRISE